MLGSRIRGISTASVLLPGIWPSRACLAFDLRIVGSRTVYGQLMQFLEIFDFEGRQEASSAEQLHRALSRRFDGGNHFEIAAVGRQYPMLDLMVSGDLAVVHYFAAEGSAGTQSIGDVGDAVETVEFPEDRAGATFTMPGSTVVSMATAISCAEEFSIDLQRPTAVTWFEL